MFRRTFWFTTGVAAGAWATTRVHRKLRRLSPESLAATAANKAIEAGGRIKDRATDFAVDVRVNMARREAELGDALGLDTPVDRALPRSGRYTALENHNSPKNDPRHAEGLTYPTRPHNRNEDH